jgi:hypothetical protein
MAHMRVITIKFLSTVALLYVVLGIAFGMSFTSVLLISIALTVAEYIIGDLIILPRTNNFRATIADLVFSFILIWSMVAGMTTVNNPAYISFIASIVVAMFEYAFHKYLARKTYSKQTMRQSIHFQAETAEEIYPFTPQEESDDKDK